MRIMGKNDARRGPAGPRPADPAERVLTAREINAAAGAAGVSACEVITVRELIRRLDESFLFGGARPGTEAVLPALSAAFPADADRGVILTVAIPYGNGDPQDPGVPGRACGVVARFARRNYYRAAVSMLQDIAATLGRQTGLFKKDFRIFVNSRIPEKLIAYGAGLGVYGRNGLLYRKDYGSRFVIGVLYIPLGMRDEAEVFRAAYDGLRTPEELCGDCTACLTACPVGALGKQQPEPGLSRCLKARSDTLEVWDDPTSEVWGQRFYGCDTCQDVCPLNRDVAPGVATSLGVIGPGVDLREILGLTEAELTRRFKKTALGLSWILPRALLRNALVAAGNAGDRRFSSAVSRYLAHPEPALAAAARFAVKKLSSG